MIVGWVLFVGACVVVLCNMIVMMRSAGRMTSGIRKMPHCDGAILLGAPEKRADGSRNLYAVYRAEAAAELYNAGKVDHIFLSGRFKEISYMQDILIAKGVSRLSIDMDDKGVRTEASLRNMLKLYDTDNRRYVIVTQRFHNYRAVFLALSMGIDAYGYSAQPVYSQRWLWVEMREVAARVLMFVDLVRRNKL